MDAFKSQEGKLYITGPLYPYLPDTGQDDYLSGLIETGNEITRLSILEQESEKSFIAYKLQEDLAQTLAATKLYLEYAEQSGDDKNQLIRQSKDAISAVIDEITYLCRAIVPTTMKRNQPGELLADMITEWEIRNKTSLDFECRANLEHFNSDTTLVLFRIIQHQLRLASYSQAPRVGIFITEDDGLHLYFEMQELKLAYSDPQKDFFIKNIAARVEMAGGKIDREDQLPAKDTMHIFLPYSYLGMVS